jgi:quercetin dioxygenase-like cupin family protein
MNKMNKLDERFFINELSQKFKKFEPTPLWTSQEATRLLFLDEDVIPGSFYMSASWFWPGDWPPQKPGTEPRIKAHKHDFDEVIAFIGSNPDDINDLGGEVEFWVDGKKNIMDKSFLVFLPAGVPHCPLNILRAERPIFHYNTGITKTYFANEKDQAVTKKADLDTRHFVTELKSNIAQQSYSPTWTPQEATRLLFLDQEVIPGAFQSSCSWFWPGEWPQPKPEDTPRMKPHKHDFDEVLGFVGSNPDDIYDLGGDVELWVDGKKNVSDKSFMAFIPAGVEHCPLNILRAERPIFHFGACATKLYR